MIKQTQVQVQASTRSVGRPKKDPNAPKKPTDYNKQIGELLKKLKLEHPEINNKDRMKIAQIECKQLKTQTA